MAKGSGNPAGKRPSSRSAQPYDANNSLVKKMANKVTDLIPQSSWISKWFNTSQGNEDTLESGERENIEETELEDDVQQPPSKRSCIRMDVIHPPGTFSIQSRVKTALNTVDSSKEQYPVHSDMTEDFMEPAIAGPSGMGRLISSTPAMQADIRNVTSHRSDLNSLTASTNNGIANGMDDNSELSESTSGCSSLIPQINRHEGPSNLLYNSFSNRKRHIDDKLTYTDHLQTSRSLLLDINSRDTLSNRRPSFNASVVANALDRASPLSSPFYSGNTTFGGANAAGLYKRGRNLFNNSSKLQLKVPGRTNVEVKSPNSTVDSSGMSQTAKKILEALEHFSSPITDAKKIPMKNTNTISSTVNRKRAREEMTNPSARIGLRHLTRELTVPTVPDILKLKRRQKLQDTTLAARKIVSARSDPPPSPQEYRLRTDDNDSGKYRGKLKGKSKINLEQEETVAAVNLPNIPLPITTLPNFNFMLPLPASHSAGKTTANKENTFTFASPIKVTDSGKNLQSVNNFTFSNPINAEDKNSNEDEQCTAFKIVWSNPNDKTSSAQKSNAAGAKDTMQETTTETVVKSKPVTNDGFGSQFQLSKDQWECTACCVRNKQSDSKCVACSTPKQGTDFAMSQTVKFQSSNLTDKLKPAEGLWECSNCLVQNAASIFVCPSCYTFKPTSPKTNTKKTDFFMESAAQKSNTAGTKETTTTEMVTKSKPVASDCFGSQFKLSEDQWECTACCVRNKQSDAKCVACCTPKSGIDSATSQAVKLQKTDLTDELKPAEGLWECSVCLVRNSASLFVCSSCITSKPTSSKTNTKKTESSAQKSNNTGKKDATIKETATEAVAKSKPVANDCFGSQFKLSQDQWECTACCVRNKQSDAKCVACYTLKPGSSSITPQTIKFPNSDSMDKFKSAEGSWECSNCLLRNAANILTCPCNTSKSSSNTNPKKTDSVAESSAQKLNISGTKDTTMQETVAKSKPVANDCFGSQFKLSKDQWECSACCVRNKQSDAKCVSCSTPKSGSRSATPQTVKFQNSDLMEKFKPAEGSWECSGCLLRNAANELTCPCCGASKPTSLKATSKKTDFATESSAQISNTAGANDTTIPETMPSNSEIMNKFKPSKDSWECPGCLVRNNNSFTSCPCCNTAKSNSLGEPNKVEQTPTKLLSFGDKFKKPEGAWTCDSCLLQNDAKHTQCVACEALKPGTVKPNVSASSSSSTLQFKFGVLDNNTSNNSGGFKFGIDKADNQSKPDAASPLNGFKFGNTQQNSGTAQFSFDKNKIPAFGSSTESKPLIFEPPKEEAKLPAFSSSAQTPAVDPVPTFGAPSNSATPSLFGSQPNPPAFGVATTTPAFGDTATTPAIFTFGSTSSQQPSSGGFNFSANANLPAAPAKPFFAFGGNSSAPQSNNNMFASFGAPTNTAPTNAPNFAFNPPKQEAPTAFGQDAATAPMFGTSQTNPQTQAPSSFSSTLPSSSTGFNFGSTALPEPASGGFNFGGMPPTAAPAGGFNFNSPTAAPTVAFDPNSRPSFNFTKGNVPAAFNAPPQSTTGSRKIKKAFRRCMR